jgi:hypothetical protein
MSCCKKNCENRALPRESLSVDAIQSLVAAVQVGLNSMSLPELADLVVLLIEENARLRRALRPEPEPVNPPKPLPNQLPLPFSE